MPAYDKEKDKVIKEIIIDDKYGRIRVGLFSYNGAEPKIGIQQEMHSQVEGVFLAYWTSKVKRVDVDTARKIHEALGELING